MALTAVDLFSGFGGTTTGAKQAGVQVKWAANHWKLAVDFHLVNHPEITHACQDLNQCDWGILPSHDIGLGSPSCQGFSPARGKDRPHHDLQRGSMWAVVDCAAYHREQAWLIENVPEVLKWVLWPSWCDAMTRLGYAVATMLVDAADNGVPQNRLRLFIILTRSRTPIDLKLRPLPHIPVDTIIDWNSPKFAPIVRPGRSPATLARIAAGRRRFGDRFVAPFYGSGSGLTGRSVHRPIGTITTRDRWMVVDGDRMRILQKEEVKAAMGFPREYRTPATHKETVHLLGNAVCPPVPKRILRALQAQI